MKTYENGTHYDFDEPKNNVGDVIAWRLKDVTGTDAFWLGNVIKYVLRRKGSDKEDLIKARNYLDEIIGGTPDENVDDVAYIRAFDLIDETKDVNADVWFAHELVGSQLLNHFYAVPIDLVDVDKEEVKEGVESWQVAYLGYGTFDAVMSGKGKDLV